MKMAKEDNEKLWDQKYDKYIKKKVYPEKTQYYKPRKK